MNHPRRGKIKTFLSWLLIAELVLQSISFIRYIQAKKNEAFRDQQRLEKNWFLRDTNSDWWTKEISTLYAEYHPFLGWLTRPIKTEHIQVNKEGIRHTTNIDSNDIQKQAIYTFGGSTMWGVFVPDNQTIPSYISQKLNDPNPKFTIVNYAQIAHNSNQELIYLTLLLKEGKIPNVAIFYDGCNDLFVNRVPGKQTTMLYENRIKSLLGNMWRFINPDPIINQSLLNGNLLRDAIRYIPKYIKLIHYPYMLLTRIFQKSTNTADDAEKNFINPIPERIAQTYAQNALMIEALSRAYNFRYLLAWQPIIFTKAAKSADEKALLTYDKMHPELLYRLATRRLREMELKKFYDLTNIFDKIDQSIFIDECHVTPQGNQIIAEKLVEILKTDYGL